MIGIAGFKFSSPTKFALAAILFGGAFLLYSLTAGEPLKTAPAGTKPRPPSKIAAAQDPLPPAPAHMKEPPKIAAAQAPSPSPEAPLKASPKTAATQEVPFYTPPNPLPEGKHGDLIRTMQIDTHVAGARAWKILYRSTTVNDEAVAVSGIVIAPVGPAPDGGRPVVSWGHGTSGIARHCAPSLAEDPARDANFYYSADGAAPFDIGVPALARLIKAGYVVAATDYNGLGTPGQHHYLIGSTEARNLLDAALAARQILNSGAGDRIVALGWSQGGQAAIWAAQMPKYLDDEAKLAGAVALAPMSAPDQIKAFGILTAAGKPLPASSRAERMMSWYVATLVFPDLKLSDVLTPHGLAFIAQASKRQCSHQMAEALNYLERLKGPAARRAPVNEEAWWKRYQQLASGNAPALVPVAVFQGEDDMTVVPMATDAYVRKACAAGATLFYTRYAATDHIQLASRAENDFLAWIAGRFAGKPAASNCGEVKKDQRRVSEAAR